MGDTQYGESLNVKGSYNESGVQDFSKPTVITTQESNADVTSLLMDVAANNKPVTIEGLTFINKIQTAEQECRQVRAEARLRLKCRLPWQ